MVSLPVEDSEEPNQSSRKITTGNKSKASEEIMEDELETSITDNTTFSKANIEAMEIDSSTATDNAKRKRNDQQEDNDYMMSMELNETDLQMMQEKEKHHRARQIILEKKSGKTSKTVKTGNNEAKITKEKTGNTKIKPVVKEVINLLSQTANRRATSRRPKMIKQADCDTSNASEKEFAKSPFIQVQQLHDITTNLRTFNLRLEFTTKESVQQADKFLFEILDNIQKVDENVIIYSNQTHAKVKNQENITLERVKDLFKIYSITKDNTPPDNAVICFRITTTATLRDIKSYPTVSKILRENQIYLKTHHWSTDHWNPTLLCWRLLVHPDREVDSMVIEEFMERLDQNNVQWPSEIQLAITKGKHSSKEKDGSIISTTAFNIQVLPQYKMKAMEIVKKLYKGDKCMVQATLKKENPTGYTNAICIQNSYISQFRAIKCTGFTENIMFYLRERIFDQGINSFTWKQNYDPYGTVYLNTNKEDFNTVGKCILQKLPQWIEEISADALHTGYENPPQCHFKEISQNKENKTQKASNQKSKVDPYNDEASLTYGKLYREIQKHFPPPKQQPPSRPYLTTSWASVVSSGSVSHYQPNTNKSVTTTQATTTEYKTPNKATDFANKVHRTANSSSDEISTLTNEVEILKTDLKKLNNNIQDMTELKSDINELKTLKDDMTSIKEHHKKNESLQDELHSLKNTITSLVELTTNLTKQNQQFQASIQLMMANQASQYFLQPPSKPPDEYQSQKRTPTSPAINVAKRLDSKTTPIKNSFIQSPTFEHSQISLDDTGFLANKQNIINSGSKVDSLEHVSKNLVTTFQKSDDEHHQNAPISMGQCVT